MHGVYQSTSKSRAKCRVQQAARTPACIQRETSPKRVHVGCITHPSETPESHARTRRETACRDK
eukprot:38353-Eustigmatos_ZCMA.PRE.1